MAHSHSHSHKGHSHGHGHHHTQLPLGRTFLIAAALNLLFILAEVIYGFQANSLALLADAGHNFSDVLGLLISWAAYLLSKRRASARYTYGLRSTSIMAALINAVMLLVAVGGIIWEAIERFNSQVPVASTTVIVVAAIGILINGGTAWMFSKGQQDLNVKSAFLHLAGDAVISLGVVITGIIVFYTGWTWCDPVISLVIAIVIILGTWGLLRDSVNLALHAVPAGIDTLTVKAYLMEQAGVKDVHDLHIWGISTTETALSAHLLMPDGHPGDDFLEQLSAELHRRFSIAHVTVQIEIGDGQHACPLAGDHGGFRI